jgi:hypothetical protein
MLELVSKLIDCLLVCGTILIFTSIGFVTMLTMMVLDKPENLAKLLTIIKEHFDAYFSRD